MNEWKFKYSSAPGNVHKLFEVWSPAKGNDENHYKKELYKYLRAKFRGSKVQKEYEQENVRADFAIDNEILVRVVYNLQKTSDYQKLIRQILEYRTWMGKVLILLIGKTEPKMSKNIKVEIDGLNFKLFRGKTKGQFTVIEKAL
ncbi:MAG: hypothetical protein ABII79_08585 [bacterium]